MNGVQNWGYSSLMINSRTLESISCPKPVLPLQMVIRPGYGIWAWGPVKIDHYVFKVVSQNLADTVSLGLWRTILRVGELPSLKGFSL